jgi:exosortase E/protease (VPEID-CTERM system)
LPIRGWLALAKQQRIPLIAGIAAGVGAWLIGQAVQFLWTPLSVGTFAIVSTFLEFIGKQPIVRPATLTVGTENFLVQIAPACSGLEGIGLIVAFVSVYLWLDRRSLRFPQALVLLPLGVACIWLANAMRITALILLGDIGYSQLAVDAFHSKAGSLLFAGVGLGVVVLARPFCAAGTTRPRVSQILNTPTAAYLMPLFVWHLIPMLTLTAAGGIDYWYGVRVGIVSLVIAMYRRHYAAILRDWSLSAVVSGVAVFALWWAFEPGTWQGAATPAPADVSQLGTFGTSAWLAFRIIGSVLVIPIAEELAFRGYLARRLISSEFQSVSYQRWAWGVLIAVSIAFGALHGHRWIAGSIAGLIFGVLAIRRGKLSDAVIAHAVANASVAAYVLATGNWSMWL